MSKGIARLGDPTSHGGRIITGSFDVLINNRPAATAASNHICPMLTPASPPSPHIGGKAKRPKKTGVFINGKSVVCSGDEFSCTGKTAAEPTAKVIMGSGNVVIGGASSKESNDGAKRGKSDSAVDKVPPRLPAGKTGVMSGIPLIGPIIAMLKALFTKKGIDKSGSSRAASKQKSVVVKSPGRSESPAVKESDQAQPAGGKPEASPDADSRTAASETMYPVQNPLITSLFGMRIDPITGVPAGHRGIDFVSLGKTAPVYVYAVEGGTVEKVVKTPDGDGGGVRVRIGVGKDVYFYMHLEENSNKDLKVGQTAPKGHVLGIMGNTGRSTGAHLHFEIWRNGDQKTPLDPFERYPEWRSIPLKKDSEIA